MQFRRSYGHRGNMEVLSRHLGQRPAAPRIHSRVEKVNELWGLDVSMGLLQGVYSRAAQTTTRPEQRLIGRVLHSLFVSPVDHLRQSGSLGTLFATSSASLHDHRVAAGQHGRDRDDLRGVASSTSSVHMDLRCFLFLHPERLRDLNYAGRSSKIDTSVNLADVGTQALDGRPA